MTCRVVAAAVVLACAIARADDGVPRAVVEAPVHDFGQVERGVPIDHVFKVKNTGTGWMRIDHVKGTCACTVGTATGEPIPPGGEAWVTMRLETDKLAGRTTKTATVYTNDPAAPTLPVTLTGSVLSDLVVTPVPLYVGHVPSGAVVRREIVVTPGRPNGTATVTAVETASPRLKAWVEPAVGADGQRVVVEVRTDQPGRFTDEIVLKTTSAAEPAMPVKVVGTIDDRG
jgi:uncharacterized protein DUF1573